ncbi:MAG: carbohydrate ABC transporter permease [Rhizobiales bacterium]|jgi:multiple sugar transport system permease protein|nr:carbohydrate ABC transporter permease [Hyphomicrobiales bacterium]MBO6698528.1 carbohydrate ABC transporter permease [Hyphomicrobiales bacterium]MBO6735218.1 carbohydrate ABC transporter permease [Hyphomicrobiales bacterium]MBO6910974.1 carbohydrate ABC transporter permease [Hyphomicrobiales bacterium]MBO6956017.1 carbohydrate ABC transporter permease [Hyphomicrobiales bacterium]
MNRALKKQLKAAGLWFVTFILMVIMCVPGLWVVLSAFRPNREILAKPPIWVPQNPTLNNFAKIFGFGEDQVAIPVLSYFWNSLVIASTSTVIALIIGMAGGYAFARFRFRFKNSVFLGLMLFRAVPGIALSLPVFMLWSRLGLIDTQMGIIIVYVSLNVPFTIWLIDGFFRQIPMSLSEAAQVDGCTRWQAFWKIEFPLARSGIAAAGVFAFLTSWNEFALASQLTRSTDSKTLPVGLMDFTAQFTIDWAGMCAMAVIIIVPALLLTFLVQKHLIAGLTFGGVKG